MQFTASKVRASLVKNVKSDTKRLMHLEALCGEHINWSINQRALFLESLTKNSQDGMVGMIITSTDCDHARSHYARVISVDEVRAYIDEEQSETEGTWSYQFCTPSYARAFKSTHRDLALEAFEDGHSHVIYA